MKTTSQIKDRLDLLSGNLTMDSVTAENLAELVEIVQLIATQLPPKEEPRTYTTHRTNLKIYLAARYSRREELCVYRTELQAMGHTVQARWLNGGHQLGNDGTPIGENGEALVEAKTVDAAELRTKFALDDWEDVNAADLVISFTEPPRSKANRGGRHVEYGIALAKNTRVIVVGHRENIFHWLPVVEFYETWGEARKTLSA